MLDTKGMEDVPLGPMVHEPYYTDSDWELVDPRYDAPPHTPSTTSDEAPAANHRDFSGADSDEDADAHAHGELVPRRKPGGYDSRVEQMLYENPELPILITDAGKSTESGGRYIVYTIKTGVRLDADTLLPSTNRRTGPHRAQKILGVRLSSRDTDETTPNPHHPPHTRETYYGRLCSKSNQCEAGSTDHRSAETHAGSLSEPLPAYGAGADRWCLVAILGSKLQLERGCPHTPCCLNTQVYHESSAP